MFNDYNSKKILPLPNETLATFKLICFIFSLVKIKTKQVLYKLITTIWPTAATQQMAMKWNDTIVQFEEWSLFSSFNFKETSTHIIYLECFSLDPLASRSIKLE